MNLQNQVDWCQLNGYDMFTGVAVPEPLNTETAKSAIMLHLGLLTPLYSEPLTMRDAITTWFTVHAWDIIKMVELANTDYKPLENYRRVETNKRDVSEQAKENEETEATGTSETETETSTETEDKVSAYNDSTYSPERLRTTSGTSNTENETSDTASRERTETRGKKDEYSGTTYGNIGVTTSQQMFLEEVTLLTNFNPYMWLVDMLERDLFLGIY